MTERRTKSLTEAQKLGQALKRLRNASGLTQKQAGEAIGADQQTWQRYEAGYNSILRIDLQRKLAQAVGATDENLRLEVARIGEPLPVMRTGTHGGASFAEPSARIFQLPVVGKLKPSQDGPKIYDTPDQVGSLDLMDLFGGEPRAMRMPDDSMYPRARQGAMVVFDMADPFPRKDQTCVVILADGEMLVRQFQRQAGNSVYVASLHPEAKDAVFDLTAIKGVYAVTYIGE